MQKTKIQLGVPIAITAGTAFGQPVIRSTAADFAVRRRSGLSRISQFKHCRVTGSLVPARHPDYRGRPWLLQEVYLHEY